MNQERCDGKGITGRYFVITGKLFYMTRTMAAQLIQTYGGSFQPQVTKSTNYLVVGFIRDNRCTNKITRARMLQTQGHSITIISQKEFYDMLINEISLNM